MSAAQLPSSSDLTYFLEVAQTANLSRAAERLGISQPSLSLAIKRLEDVVGVELLYRSKKGVTLTPAGKHVSLRAQELLKLWQGVRHRAEAAHQSVEGTVTLGVHPSVALYSLGFLPEFLKEHPKLDVRLEHGLSRQITEKVISMDVDVGIVVNPVRHPDLVIKKLCSDEVTVFTPKKRTPLSDPRSGEGILIMEPQLTQTQSLLKKLERSGVSYARVMTSSNLEVVADLVARGCGMAILPGRVAAKTGNLKAFPGAPVYKDEICLVTRVEHRGVRALEALSSAIKLT